MLTAADDDITTPMTEEPHVTWQDLAQAAAQNSGIELTPPAPLASPDIIEIDDSEDDTFGMAILPDYPVPPVKIESDESDHSNDPVDDVTTPIGDLTPPPAVQPRRSGRTRTVPDRYKPFHLYTTVADDSPASHIYVNSAGQSVDISLPDMQVAAICHHLVVHAVECSATRSAPPGKQLGLKKGLKTFGDHGTDALLTEMTQFHMLNCFTPLDAKIFVARPKTKCSDIAYVSYQKTQRRNQSSWMC